MNFEDLQDQQEKLIIFWLLPKIFSFQTIARNSEKKILLQQLLFIVFERLHEITIAFFKYSRKYLLAV